MRLTSVNAIYWHLAKTYDRDLRDKMQYTAYLKVPERVIDALGHQQSTILDLGCGTGLSSLLFFERGYDVVGIDGTSEMIHRARKLPYRQVIQQDLETPWRVNDQSFNAVVMIGVMEYIIYPRKLFRQVHTKLVDDGVFGLTVPHKSQIYTDAGLKSYYRKEIVPVMREAGFTIESSEKTLGYQEAGKKVLYWNYLLRKR
jgi:predicted TPR repeat methyltransferase